MRRHPPCASKNFSEIALDKLGILWQTANYMGVNYMAVIC